MNEHEKGFLEFLEEPGRRRLKTLLELGPKRRSDFRAHLDHTTQLSARFRQHLKGSASSRSSIETMLRERGAPATCFVLSANENLDGREMPLDEALDAIVGASDGAFISCVPGRLGFYEYEGMKASYLLSK